jgi:hypothetical protein
VQAPDKVGGVLVSDYYDKQQKTFFTLPPKKIANSREAHFVQLKDQVT